MKNKESKRLIKEFTKELICYIIVLIIVVIIGNKFWEEKATIDNIIEIIVGWIIWKIIMYVIDKHKQQKQLQNYNSFG